MNDLEREAKNVNEMYDGLEAELKGRIARTVSFRTKEMLERHLVILRERRDLRLKEIARKQAELIESGQNAKASR
jgi:hypothetical protein